MLHYLTWILITTLYLPVFFQLYQSRWETIDYTHAYFILPISLWIVWKKRQALKEIIRKTFSDKNSHLQKKPALSELAGLSAVLAGLMMFILGWRREYLVISSLSLIPVLWGTIKYLYGNRAVKSLTFPIFYLLFLVPPPMGIIDAITMPMRFGISHITEIVLRMFGYPITRRGLLLIIDGNEIFMGAPCSGFRSLITLLALAVAYVYFIKGNLKKKLALIFASFPLALFGNLTRVITLCLITFYLGQETAEGFFHDFSGAIIFLVMIAGLMGLEYLINKLQKNRSNI